MELSEHPASASDAGLEQELFLWEHAVVSVADIRHYRFDPGSGFRDYQTPAGMLLYVSGGSGQVWLDEVPYHMNRFGLFHGGKGTRLSVVPAAYPLECYIVLYKARLPLTGKRGWKRMPEGVNPFGRQYGLCPENPLLFAGQLMRMHERWRSASPWRRLYAKASLLQLVCEAYEELASNQGAMLQPDLVAMARRSISQHYHEPLSIQELANMLHISYSHLHRMFKQQTGESPQDYLIRKRLEAAKRHLAGSPGSMRDIALACGFNDEHNLIRTFKSRTGMTPGEYREKMSMKWRDGGIGLAGTGLYTDGRIEGQFKLQHKGDHTMRTKSKANLVLTAALGLTLILSACGGAGADTGAAGSSLPSPVSSEQAAKAPESGTRIVKTVKGEIEVPAHPQKVAVNWYLGDVCALGIKPVAFSGWKQETMPFYQELDGIEALKPWEAENIMTFEPEVIVTYKAEEFDKLSKVAPVIVIEESLSPEDRLLFLGQALGREAEAKAVVENFHKKLEEAKIKLTSNQFADKTFSIMEDWGPSGEWSGVAYETGSRGGTLVYKYLGLKKPAKLEELIASNKKGRATLSYEVAHEYFGDYILWFRQEGKESEYAKTDIWKSIPAVAQGRVLEIPGNYQGLFYYDDVGSLTGQLAYIQDKLAALVQ
ncbi:AraC family transcriptional regulator [Paenibacillus sp. YN15]|uniref:AraC family transcriptional regulator n=1 Tax=Paenibacillus sp. YN15 TaxID=1742774 RepID=UPI000DCAEE6A|nr:helix-turn-helix domain-containing protein [Paenibacillus sp. YN15]RAU92471.1 hypothetical protein DQG13_27450 [Paenibacillus sp. YN15]